MTTQPPSGSASVRPLAHGIAGMKKALLATAVPSLPQVLQHVLTRTLLDERGMLYAWIKYGYTLHYTRHLPLS